MLAEEGGALKHRDAESAGWQLLMAGLQDSNKIIKLPAETLGAKGVHAQSIRCWPTWPALPQMLPCAALQVTSACHDVSCVGFGNSLAFSKNNN